MRQKNETATIFNQLKEIMQIMQAQQKGRAKTSENTHASDNTQKLALKPKDSVKAKGVLKPTKKAFSEHQNTAFKDHSQASANLSYQTKASHNANAFKTEQGNNSSLKSDQSDEALGQGLATHQTNQKGGKNEA
ncbi:hypothetical protein E5K43_01045 [Helicobacter pylori]|nr:hypothetical protein E5K43_01045 [Helicobacter pylori]